MRILTNNQRIRRTLCLAAWGLLLVGMFCPTSTYAQGCVIARGAPVCTLSHDHDAFLQPGGWQATVAHRWFRSDRHFVGREEQPQRQANGTEVINDSHFIDVVGTYAFTRQLSVNLTVPWVIHDRSSLYEHLGNASGQRFHTQAAGLADMRLGVNYWLVKPEDYPKGNIGFGIGVKAPTGDYKATDVFTRPAGPTIRYVDSSIQPGDGGWGFFLETQGYHQIWGNLSAYMNGTYLFNPRERVPATGFSVPDSYLGRVGFAYTILPKYGFGLSFGARIEGVPPEDAIGGSLGSRRPGYSLGVEPGLYLAVGKFSFNLTTPVAIERNRQRTYNAATTGDAAFADYSINSSLSYRF
jgi:hypothetical protein